MTRVDHDVNDDHASDAYLFDLARQGCEQAWNDLVVRHSGALTSVARRHRLNHADTADVVQTTWLRCMQHAHRIHAPDRIRSWLLTTCRNECLRVLRHRSRHVPCDPAEQPLFVPAEGRHASTDPGARLLQEEVRAILTAALEELPERQRRVVEALVIADDRDHQWYAAVAERLQVPIGSLGPTRQRALRRLRHGRAVTTLLA